MECTSYETFKALECASALSQHQFLQDCKRTPFFLFLAEPQDGQVSLKINVLFPSFASSLLSIARYLH